MNRGIIKNKWSSIALKSKAVLRPVRQMAWKCKTREVTKHCLSQNIYITKIQPETSKIALTQAKSLQLCNMSWAISMLVNYSIFQSLLKVPSRDSVSLRYKGCSCPARHIKGRGRNMGKSSEFHYPFSYFVHKIPKYNHYRVMPKAHHMECKDRNPTVTIVPHLYVTCECSINLFWTCNPFPFSPYFLDPGNH